MSQPEEVPLPSRAAFGAAIGTPFLADAAGGPGGPAELLLRSVEDRKAPSGWECFSMTFAGPSAAPLSQGSHPLRHAALGAMELFLVPLSDRDGTRTYEAVVYRPAPDAPEGGLA